MVAVHQNKRTLKKMEKFIYKIGNWAKEFQNRTQNIQFGKYRKQTQESLSDQQRTLT